VYEPRYLAMFRAMLEVAPGGKGARFVHVLSPAAAPPALLETAVGGLPRIACVAEVESIEVKLQAAHCTGTVAQAIPCLHCSKSVGHGEGLHRRSALTARWQWHMAAHGVCSF
jgi:hypothetical protein